MPHACRPLTYTVGAEKPEENEIAKKEGELETEVKKRGK
jgi:hypothetical protein